VGVASGSVTITGSGTVVGAPVPLSGNGIRADLTVSANSPLLSFGDVFVGQASAAQTVTLTNTSTAAVTGINLLGLAPAGPFARSGGSCPITANFSLTTAGSTCTVGIVFRPNALNPVSGSLGVTAASAFGVVGSPLPLTGNGLQPAVTPSPLDVGTVAVGTSAVQTLTLDNSTNANSNSLAFPISSIGVSGAGYSRPAGSAGGTCVAGTSLAAGATCTIIIRFTATSINLATGSLTITGGSGATVSGSPVSLTANGPPPAAATRVLSAGGAH
jgi:hypothetical protein